MASLDQKEYYYHLTIRTVDDRKGNDLPILLANIRLVTTDQLGILRLRGICNFSPWLRSGPARKKPNYRLCSNS